MHLKCVACHFPHEKGRWRQRMTIFHPEWKGLIWRMLIVSSKLPWSISTVPLLSTCLMVKGSLAGASTFGWLQCSSGSYTSRTWSPGEYCFAMSDLFSFSLDNSLSRLRSLWTEAQSISNAWRTICVSYWYAYRKQQWHRLKGARWKNLYALYAFIHYIQR